MQFHDVESSKESQSNIHNKIKFVSINSLLEIHVFCFVHHVNIYEDSAIIVYSIKNTELH